MSLCEKFPAILRLILLLAILRASDTAVGWAQPNSSTDRIAPAKKEGLVNLYTSWDLDRSGEMKRLFEKRYPGSLRHSNIARISSVRCLEFGS